MREIEFGNGEFYHVYNRGVEHRPIFINQQDYRQFYETMFLFNNKDYTNPSGKTEKNAQMLAVSGVSDVFRDRFVRIVAFCLLRNHFHFFLEQLVDGGVSKFKHKLEMRYGKRFNKLYNRSGVLLEGPFEAKHLDNEAYFSHIIRYIHLNALDEHFSQWREGKIDNWEEAMAILNEYPWSSHSVYLQKGQFLPVVDEDFVKNLFPDVHEYINFLRQWAEREKGLSPGDHPLSPGDNPFWELDL